MSCPALGEDLATLGDFFLPGLKHHWSVVRTNIDFLICLSFCTSLQPPPKQVPKTLENTRVFDETVVEVHDEEVGQ